MRKSKRRLALSCMVMCAVWLPTSGSMYAQGVNTGKQQQAVTNKDAVRVVKGTVVDYNGQPLPGASVLIKGTKNAVVTDVDGKFAINLGSNENVQLRVTFLGMQDKTVRVRPQTKQLRIVLEQDENMLDECLTRLLLLRLVTTA